MAKLQSMESTRWRSWWKKHAFTTSYTLICYFLIKFKQYSFLKVNNILLIIKRTIFKSPSIWFTRFLSCISIFGWVSNHSHFQYIYIDQLNSFSNCDLIAQKKKQIFYHPNKRNPWKQGTRFNCLACTRASNKLYNCQFFKK
jgi:hypothetical protein